MISTVSAGAPARHASFKAEVLKFKHAAPARLAIALALPMPLLGAWPTPGTGEQVFSAWNYWYTLFLPVMLALVSACVANADARLRLRPLLGVGVPLARAWWAKVLYCLRLSCWANLIVCAIYLASSAFSAQGLTLAGAWSMFACAAVNIITTSWMVPSGLFLTSRAGMLAGIFVPLAIQVTGGLAWSIIPFPQLVPPSATMVIPTSFIPVLPSGEPFSVDAALGATLFSNPSLVCAGLAVCAAFCIVLTVAGAAWLEGAEER